ncbi:MAG: cytochrome b/b6 domain-containing protein, partial [Candidatus Micrarchaeaceae archaeon]
MVVVNRVKVERHGLFMRVAHWLVLVEGIILTLTGFQLGGILGINLFPDDNMSIHVMTGLIFIVTATLAVYDMVITGDYFWVRLQRIPYSFKYILL